LHGLRLRKLTIEGGYLQVLKNNTGVIKVFDPISTQMLIFSIIL